MLDNCINYYNTTNTTSYLIKTSCVKIMRFFFKLSKLTFKEKAYTIYRFVIIIEFEKLNAINRDFFITIICF